MAGCQVAILSVGSCSNRTSLCATALLYNVELNFITSLTASVAHRSLYNNVTFTKIDRTQSPMTFDRCLKTELSVIVMQYSCFETIFMRIIHILYVCIICVMQVMN